MKYSNMLIIASIGSAALVAAENLSAHNTPPSDVSAAHNNPASNHATPHTTPPKHSRSKSFAQKAGKLITSFGTYTKHATGNGYRPNTYSNDPYANTDTYNSDNSGIYRRFKLPHFHLPHLPVKAPHITKPQVMSAASRVKTAASSGAKSAATGMRHAATKGKDFTRTAVQAGGGSKAVAENLGNIAYYLKTKNQQATSTDPYAADPYAANAYGSVYRRDEEAKYSGRHRGSGKRRLPLQESDSTFLRDVFSRDLNFDEDNLLARDSWWGYSRSNREETKAPVTSRGFDEMDMQERDSYPEEGPAARSFEEDEVMFSRDLVDEDEFALRSFNEDLDSRDLNEEFDVYERNAEIEDRDIFEDHLDIRGLEIDELD